MAFTWRSNYVDGKTKLLQKEGNALLLLGPKRNCVLWVSETGRNCRCTSLPATSCQLKPSITRRMARMRYKRHKRVILLHDNPPCITIIQHTIQGLKWDLLPHPLYSSDLTQSDYYFFRSKTYGLDGLHLVNFEEVQNDFGPKIRRLIFAVLVYCQRYGKNRWLVRNDTLNK